MPRYNYECLDCKDSAFSKHKKLLHIGPSGEQELPVELYEELVLFETYHPIKPTKKEYKAATECPRCGGHNSQKTMYGSDISGYIRGYGFLDRTGAVRDMNRYKLANDDPYAQYRVPGEVDHIDQTLKKQGQHDPKRKHFLTAQSDTNKKIKDKKDN